MDGYKHYISLDTENNVIRGYTSGFPELAQDGDICILEDGPRSFHEAWPEPLRNKEGQTLWRWINRQRVERPQEDLDAELAARPSPPPSELDIVGQQLVQRVLESLALQSSQDVLGNQMVALDLRLLQGGL